MKNIIVTAFALLIVLSACEKEIDIDMPQYTPSVVIEGTIVSNMAPVVVLTKNVNYVSTAGKELYENSFIYNALITVETSDGIIDTLTEKSTEDAKMGIVYYQYTSDKLIGESGKSYTLKVTTGGKTYSALATIPPSVKIQELWYENHPDAENDSFKIVRIKILDPAGPNYYRYTSEVNGKHSAQAEISTFSDKAFEGKEYTKAIDSGLENEEQDLHGGVSGYFKAGDTITVKLGNAEKSYYDAWTTIDFKRSQNQNPFLSPTRIVGNIKGALGYWSGIGGDKKSIVLK